MAAILKWRSQLENRTLHSMSISIQNIRVKFHPDPIWNDEALGCYREVAPTKSNMNKISSDMRSVPDLKIVIILGNLITVIP